jgi:hypothetical protein
MAAVQVMADDEPKRVFPVIDHRDRLTANGFAGAIPMTAIKNLVFVDDDGVAQAISPDVIHQRIELIIRHGREKLAKLVRLPL